MIIFDLDGTLADCEHRRHFVDPKKNLEYLPIYAKPFDYMDPKTGKMFTPDWQAFDEACDQDKVIRQVRSIFDFIGMNGQAHELQICSGRCESVREKTQEWLKKYSFAYATHQFDIGLKMRPIGDSTPDDQLKERWLDELWPNLEPCKEGDMGKVYYRPDVDFVFTSNPKEIAMWRRRGIFVFNCAQNDKEF